MVKFAELESAIIPNGHTEDLRAALARKASVGEVSGGMIAELESAIIPNGHTEDLRATLARKASVGEVSEGMIAELESGGKKI